MKLKKNIQLIDQHNKRGFYLGKFGGNIVAETAIKPIEDLSPLLSRKEFKENMLIDIEKRKSKIVEIN